MYKIVALAVAAVVALSASVPALADSKEAAEFVLKTCLPAMDDLSKVEAMARQGNWFALPPNPAIDRNSIAPGSGWRVNKFVVRTWTWIKTAPTIRPASSRCWVIRRSIGTNFSIRSRRP
jgi:hypothetical protein